MSEVVGMCENLSIVFRTFHHGDFRHVCFNTWYAYIPSWIHFHNYIIVMKNFHSHESQVGKLLRKQTKDPTLFPLHVSIMRWPRQTVKQTSQLHRGQLDGFGTMHASCFPELASKLCLSHLQFGVWWNISGAFAYCTSHLILIMLIKIEQLCTNCYMHF